MSTNKEQVVTITWPETEPAPTVEWNALYSEATGELVDAWVSEMDEPR